METDYEPRKKISRRKMLEICGLAGGGALMFGGTIYSILATPSKPSNLVRYTEISVELKSFPRNVSLENLESESPKLIHRANELRAERDKITQSPDFDEVRETYESEKNKIFWRQNYSIISGIAISLSSIVSSYIKSRKEMTRSPKSFRSF